CLPICLSVYLPICLSVCLYVCPSVCLSVCLSVCPSVCLSVCMCACVCVGVRMCVCLSMWVCVFHIHAIYCQCKTKKEDTLFSHFYVVTETAIENNRITYNISGWVGFANAHAHL